VRLISHLDPLVTEREVAILSIARALDSQTLELQGFLTGSWAAAYARGNVTAEEIAIEFCLRAAGHPA
jgi:hypothetical protein